MTDNPKDGKPDVAAGASKQRRRTVDAAVLGELLRALGDESHPEHLTAVNSLVRMGPSVVSEVARTVTPDRPWLGVYHALDVLVELGDGRGINALLRGLRHPNANVRWNAVRGIGKLGDPRGLFALRRVARRDEGRTSWGESVSGAAREILAEYGRKPLVRWGREIILTALALSVLVFAVGLVQQLLDDVERELQVFGRQDAGIEVPTLVLPTVTPRPTREATSVPTAVPTPVAVEEVTGSVLQTANVRPVPGTGNNPIGTVVAGERLVLTARSADGQWLLVRLVSPTAGGSQIGSADGSGWVSRSLMTDVIGDEAGLPVVTP